MKRKIETMNSLRRTVLELLLGITVCALMCEGVGLIFVKKKTFYTVGLIYGTILAVFMTLHMAHNLNDALDWDEENARKVAKRGTFIRYLTVTVLAGMLAYFKFGNLLSCFLGMMSLKAAAYLQPLTHKSINHILKINEEGGCKNAIIDDEDADDLSDWFEHRFYDSWFN